MKRLSKKQTILTHMDLEELVHASFRYYLGRRTIATVAFATNLAKVFFVLSDKTKEMLTRELLQAYAEVEKNPAWKSLGDQCDKEAWDLVKEQCLFYKSTQL